MTKAAFDTVIHAPNRLQICALLETTKELEFQIVKEQLDVSDSVLSKHCLLYTSPSPRDRG